MEKNDKFVQIFDLENNKKLNLTPYTYAIMQYTLIYNIKLTRFIFNQLQQQALSQKCDKQTVLDNTIEFITFNKKLLLRKKPIYDREFYPIQDMMVASYNNVAFLDNKNLVKNKLIKSLKHVALDLKVNYDHFYYQKERINKTINLIETLQKSPTFIETNQIQHT